jgi:hypothetical protein
LVQKIYRLSAFFTTHEVKSYSQNTFHNISDSLAKKRCQQTRTYSKPWISLPSSYFSWNKISKTFKLHKFYLNLLSIQNFNKFLQLKAIRNIQLFNIQQFAEIINLQNFNTKLYSLRNKILLNNLLIIANLHIRYPLLYLTSNYSTCNQYKNIEHLLTWLSFSYNSSNILITYITTSFNSLNLSENLLYPILQTFN